MKKDRRRRRSVYCRRSKTPGRKTRTQFFISEPTRHDKGPRPRRPRRSRGPKRQETLERCFLRCSLHASAWALHICPIQWCWQLVGRTKTFQLPPAKITRRSRGNCSRQKPRLWWSQCHQRRLTASCTTRPFLRRPGTFSPTSLGREGSNCASPRLELNSSMSLWLKA